MDRAGRIAAGERDLNAARAAVDRFQAALDEFASAQGEVARVSAYLGSEEWFGDRDAWAAGEVPNDVRAGVLSEDLGYDLIVDNRDTAIRMLEVATAILRDL